MIRLLKFCAYPQIIETEAALDGRGICLVTNDDRQRGRFENFHAEQIFVLAQPFDRTRTIRIRPGENLHLSIIRTLHSVQTVMNQLSEKFGSFYSLNEY